MSPRIVVVGVNHRTAPVEIRERVAVSADALEASVRELKRSDVLAEVMLVATCNRVEVYVTGADADIVAMEARGFFARRGGAGVERHLYVHRDDAAVRHAFRVCASLDSLVVGEPQILGQMKEAFAIARTAGGVRGTLGRMMSRAFQSAKRVRAETGIANGQVSVASVAVDLARGIFGDLAGRKVLVVGAGKMALGAARALTHQGAVLDIANRSFDKAEQLAREYGGVAHPLADVTLLLQHGDVVVCSTGAERYVLTREDVQSAMKGRRGRALFLIDIAVPRNIDPRAGDLDSVYLYNVDDLERIVAEGSSIRSAAAVAAERVVDTELEAYQRELRAAGAGPTITALRERFHATAQAELERSLGGRLRHLGPDDRKAIEAMLDAMVNKLLHAPTVSLREHANTPDGGHAVAMVRALFALPTEDSVRDETRHDDSAGGHG